MLYNNVYIESFGYKLPDEIVTSDEIEERLSSLYERLNLPKGRLELMSGIKERRFWEKGTMPSEVSIIAGQDAITKAGVKANNIDCVINCSVCRDFIEPATASVIHNGLNLKSDAMNFDISNACLGIASGMIVAGNMIELGHASRVLLVAGESSRQLVENTIDHLLLDKSLTRKTVKPFFASLTIGSSAVAVLLTSDKANAKCKLIGGIGLSDTKYNNLCQGDSDKGMSKDSAPQMMTNSEELLIRGVNLAKRTWVKCKEELLWENNTPDLICSHQVGVAHRKLLYSSLDLDAKKDYSTLEFLGNCGSVSMPITTAMALEKGRITKENKVAMLGIGSGINSLMLGLQF